MDSKSVSGDPKNTTENAASSSRGISRRSVVKAGAAAAWTVPLVQVVAAAPAHATSGTATTLMWTTLSASYAGGMGEDNGKSLSATTVIKNTGTQPASPLQITLQFPSAFSDASVGAPTGWTVSSSTTTHTFTAAAPLAAGQSTGFTAIFSRASRAGGGFTLSGTASATNADPIATAAAVSGLAVLSIPTLSSTLSPNKKIATLTAEVQNAASPNRQASNVEIKVTMVRGGLTPVVPPSSWTCTGVSGSTYTFRRSGVLSPGVTSETLTATFDYNSNTGSNSNFTLIGTATGTDALSTSRSVGGQQG